MCNGFVIEIFRFWWFTVKIRYYNSQFFGHTTHQDLVKQFNDGMKQLDVNKLIQISLDGPSVNHKFLEEVSKKRKGDEQHQLINIGTCGLHTIHGAFKTGAKNVKLNIKQTSKGAWQVSSTARWFCIFDWNESLSSLLLCHQVDTAFEPKETIDATCTYQLLELQITYLIMQ